MENSATKNMEISFLYRKFYLFMVKLKSTVYLCAKGGVDMVGINEEEEIKAEQLKNNSFEARRMRNLYELGFNSDEERQAPTKNPPRTKDVFSQREIRSYEGTNSLNSRSETHAQRPEPQQRPVSSQTRSAPQQRPVSSQTRSAPQQRPAGGQIRPAPPPVKPKQPQTKSYAKSGSALSSQRDNYRTYRQPDERITAEKIKREREAKRAEELREKRLNRLIKTLTAFVITLTVFISMYALVIFGNVPFITKWRNIWIETAMTTDQHKWLATTFFPEALINDVMNAQVDITDIGKTDIQKEENDDILGQKNLVVGEKDSHGNEVLINDIEQGIVVLKVKTSNFVGRLVLIDDPSRVYITATDYKNSRGEFICDYLEKEDAVIGMNASGFHDPGGTSVGGVVTAQCIAQGEYWGTYSSKYITVGFDEDDRLVVGEFSNWDDYKLRDAFQYHPALIINGDKVIEGSSGWGLQPRSVIGQAENGVVMFLVVDGRQVGYSLGATMGDCADILEEYGAVNAGACDGGSSSVLAYEGEILNEPSTNMPTGRYLPNAWVVARKTTE